MPKIIVEYEVADQKQMPALRTLVSTAIQPQIALKSWRILEEEDDGESKVPKTPRTERESGNAKRGRESQSQGQAGGVQSGGRKDSKKQVSRDQDDRLSRGSVSGGQEGNLSNSTKG